MLNCWKELDGYRSFVKENWKEFHVEGWGMYVLKEKFKMIKEKLKRWNKEQTQNLGEKIVYAKKKLNMLEIKGETSSLLENEVKAKRELAEKVHNFLRLNFSIQWQRSTIRWLKDGDTNSKYFHGCINKRRRNSGILTLKENDRMLRGVEEIKEPIINHFHSQF